LPANFYFAKAAEEKNAENLLILKLKELAKNWFNHKSHSDVYSGRK
jgi:hypothetical protein